MAIYFQMDKHFWPLLLRFHYPNNRQMLELEPKLELELELELEPELDQPLCFSQTPFASSSAAISGHIDCHFLPYRLPFSALSIAISGPD